MNIEDKLESLRKLMENNNIDAYYIGTEDFHLSEYVGDYFKSREYMSGFTGSAGTLIVTMEEACLWTDGRYFIQGEEQLKNTEIILQKSGEIGVPTILEYLLGNIPCGGCLGLDGRCIAANIGIDFFEELQSSEIVLNSNLDLVETIWRERPSLPKGDVYVLPNSVVGKEAKEKIKDLRDSLINKSVVCQFITSLDDIAWLLNMRGRDIDYNPLILAYAFISQDRFILFTDEDKFDQKVEKHLKELRVEIRKYEDVYEFCDEFRANGCIALDVSKTNYSIYERLSKNNDIEDSISQTTNAKAIKNSVEIESTKKVHLKDAVAMVKFIKWLKENVGTIEITELSASKKLFDLRKKQGCIEESFETIAGYAQHGAIVHYAATPETNAVLKPENMILVDSGGHYLGGTTDITRTIILGNISKEAKLHFTAVLTGMFSLANTVFDKRYLAAQLDAIARRPLWKLGLDYNHGTGHGVGHMLNVHEYPNNISGRNLGYSVPFEPGMINSDEPGLYIEGKYGIRHENELLCVQSKQGSGYLGFEYLTYVPFDLEGIDMKYISNETKEQLNEYHQMVFEKISPMLDSVDEVNWLENATRTI